MNRTGGYAFEAMWWFIVIIAFSMTVVFVLFRISFDDRNAMATQGLDYAQAIEEDLGSMVQIFSFYAEDALDNDFDHAVDYFYIDHQLTPGSSPMHYPGLSIYFKTRDTTDSFYSFSSDINCSIMNESDNRSIYNPDSLGKFGVRFRRKNPDVYQYSLSEYEQAVICFRSPEPVEFDDWITLKIIPKHGHPLMLQKEMPHNLVTKRITIHPVTH